MNIDLNAGSHFAAFQEMRQDRVSRLAQRIANAVEREIENDPVDPSELVYALAVTLTGIIDAAIKDEDREAFKQLCEKQAALCAFRSVIRNVGGITVFRLLAQISTGLQDDVCTLLGLTTVKSFQADNSQGAV